MASSFNSADVDGDWILARGLHIENIDPNDPDWTFDWWERIVVFHRSTSGEWQMVQTLADEYLIFNSDEHFAARHDLALENGIAAFSTNSGLHIFELVSGTWVSRSIVGAPQFPPVDLDFDGVTLLASDGFVFDGGDGVHASVGWALGSAGRAHRPGRMRGVLPAANVAVSGSRALVFEDGPFTSTPNDQVRVFERSGGAWQPGPTLSATAATADIRRTVRSCTCLARRCGDGRRQRHPFVPARPIRICLRRQDSAADQGARSAFCT